MALEKKQEKDEKSERTPKGYKGAHPLARAAARGQEAAEAGALAEAEPQHATAASRSRRGRQHGLG
ncbi:MAG: hypothetical protein ACXVY8_07995, partial [Gaiellaceae bacterium]